MDFDDSVMRISAQIPKGKVTTYKEIALALGGAGYSRAVGNALNGNKKPVVIPCHRVIRSNGDIGGYAGGTEKKIRLLASEGVKVANGKVMDYEKILFKHDLMKKPLGPQPRSLERSSALRPRKTNSG